MKFRKIFSTLLGILSAFTVSSFSGTFANEVDDAELLYTKIIEFLDKHIDDKPEGFDKVCSDYVKDNSGPIRVMEKDKFDCETSSEIKLYRGVTKKEYADDLKNGHIYISGNDLTINVSGSGIYTTDNRERTEAYVGDTGEVINLSLKQSARVIDRTYLEKIKNIMCQKHPDEFKQSQEIDQYNLTAEGKWNHDYLKSYFKEDYDKLDSLPKSRIDEAFKKMREELSKQSFYGKNYYLDKKDAIFYNSGLLARLLGYDVLYTDMSLENYENHEYLIVNAGVLAVCK